MTKYILPVVLVLAIIVVGGAYLLQQPQQVIQPQETKPVSEEASGEVKAPAEGPVVTGYTMADVQAHGTAASCWTVIRSTVYDLTAWITEHPGGERAILSLCGKDGTASFEDQHGGKSRPENTLAGFEIGVLK